jgi:DNA polymerase-3 subunit delta'
MDVIGFESQKRYLEQSLQKGMLSHAYLFSGPEMIGKRLFALSFAERINHSGLSFDLDPDIRVLSGKSDEGQTSIPIEDIRNLKFFLSLTPLRGERRIVVIDDAHRMTNEASNAFLKVLEEPPLHALILLISSQPEALLPTVVSRCQEVRFFSHDKVTVHTFLQSHKLSLEDNECLQTLAGGRIGWIAKTLVGSGIDQLKRDIEEFKTVARQGIAERILFAQKIAERDDRGEVVDVWLRWVRAYGTNPEKYRHVLARLIELRSILAEPQFNARLALESFFLSF